VGTELSTPLKAQRAFTNTNTMDDGVYLPVVLASHQAEAGGSPEPRIQIILSNLVRPILKALPFELQPLFVLPWSPSNNVIPPDKVLCILFRVLDMSGGCGDPA
jgi:hypothetical protein